MVDNSILMHEKALDPSAWRQTVVDAPSIKENEIPVHSFILQMASAAEEITPWGQHVAQRDRELRDFWFSESWLAGAIYGVSIRNASFAWEIVGADPTKPNPKNTIAKATQMLHNAERGEGWHKFMLKLCEDLYTQDNGAFIELLRKTKSRNSPVIGIAHLDAGRCMRTGDPEYPVIYTDRNGVEKVMRWWQVQPIEEFPSPIESMFGVQYCGVTRCLLAAQILRDIAVYKHEKVSGSFTRSLHAISNLTNQDIQKAIAMAEEQNLNRGLYRYTQPVIVAGLDPQSPLSHIQIDLATLPDAWNEDVTLKWYVAQLALAFGVDYQEFAPLMSGNLGSSQQSEILHLKTRGKGPALIMSLLENIINNSGILPSNVVFRFKEQDVRSESEKATARFTRGKDRAMRVKSGEIDEEAARELAVMDGDLPEWLIAGLERRAKTRETEQRTQDFSMDREFGQDQIFGGVQSHNTQKDRKALVRYQTKSSFGTPGGTVLGTLREDFVATLREIQNTVLREWIPTSARWVPNWMFHVTLVDSPLVDSHEFSIIYEAVKDNFNAPTITAYDMEIWKSEGAKPVVLLVDYNHELYQFQEELYTLFDKLGVPVSPYTKPGNWRPHITLGYIHDDFMVEPIQIEPVSGYMDGIEFTRSSYSTMHSVYRVVADAVDYSQPTSASQELD